MRSLLLFIIVALSSLIIGIQVSRADDPPELALWESNMNTYGDTACNNLKNMTGDTRLNETYYDGTWVFYRLKDYAKTRVAKQKWQKCADLAEAAYRDYYIVPNNGAIPGYWLFPYGLWEDYKRTKDLTSRTAIKLLGDNGLYCQDWAPLNLTEGYDFSREVAYCIGTSVVYEKAGFPRKTKLEDSVDQALGHLDQWFGDTPTATYIRPFMFALTAQGLIAWNDINPDARVLPAIKNAADKLWDTMWLPADKTFQYTNVDTTTLDPGDPGYDSGGTEPAWDLNLLIAPVWGWLFKETKDLKYLIQGDLIWEGGVTEAFLGNGKQFNQNYQRSFDYLLYRNQGPLPSASVLNYLTDLTIRVEDHEARIAALE